MISSLPLEQSEALWNTLLAKEPVLYPFYTHDWHMHWKKTLALDSNVTVFYSDDVLVPLVIANNEAHFSGGEEIADYLDCIGENTKKEAFWKELLPHLRKNKINKLILRNIPASSPTKAILDSLGAEVTTEDMTPTLELPDTGETYLQSLERKYRHECKRKLHKFTTTYPDVSFSITKDIHIPTLISLMKLSEDKKVFLTEPMEAFFMTLPSLQNVQMLQANLTSNKKTIIASVILFVVEHTLLLYNSGYDTTYQGAGFYLKAKMILWAIENNFKHYNFLQGQERYKYELGAKDVPVYRISLTT